MWHSTASSKEDASCAFQAAEQMDHLRCLLSANRTLRNPPPSDGEDRKEGVLACSWLRLFPLPTSQPSLHLTFFSSCLLYLQPFLPSKLLLLPFSSFPHSFSPSPPRVVMICVAFLPTELQGFCFTARKLFKSKCVKWVTKIQPWTKVQLVPENQTKMDASHQL